MRVGSRLAVWIAAGALTTAFRVPYWGGPYSENEGAFLTVAAELLRGEIPLTTAWFNRSPTTYVIYAIPLALPFPPDLSLDLFGTALATVAAVAVFHLLRCVVSTAWAWLGLLVYGALCADPSMHGHMAHNEIVLNALLASAVYLACRREDRPRPTLCFLAGLLIGLAGTIKEQAFCILFVVWIGIGCTRQRMVVRCLIATMGSLLPPLIIATVYGLTGNLDLWIDVLRFHATHHYALPLKALAAGPILLTKRGYAMYGSWPLWMLSVVWLGRFPWQGVGLIARLYLLGTCAMIIVTGRYYANYYYLALPPLVLCAVQYLADLGARREVRRSMLRICVAALVLFVAGVQVRFASGRVAVEVRQLSIIWWSTPPYYRALGRALRPEWPSAERLLVYGCAPTIYWYSGLRPAQPDVYSYSRGFTGPDDTPIGRLARRAAAALHQTPPDIVVVAEPLAGAGFDRVVADLLAAEYRQVASPVPPTDDDTARIQVYVRNGILIPNSEDGSRNTERPPPTGQPRS